MIHDESHNYSFKMKQNNDWMPGDAADAVDDIKIVVYEDDDMKTERRYEKDSKWNDDWSTKYKFHKNPTQEPPKNEEEKFAAWQEYRKFVEKWRNLESKMKVPKWYKFDPEASDGDFHGGTGHNSLKEMDEIMFNFLKEKQWQERVDAEEKTDENKTEEIKTEENKTEENKNKYVERSYFVVDCGQLLGIGGEAVVIRKDVAEKVVTKKSENDSKEDSERPKGRDFEALKIIPMMKHNFESEERLEEMKQRVDDRHKKADIETEFINKETRRQKANEKRAW